MLWGRSGISAAVQGVCDEAAALRLIPTLGPLCVCLVLVFRSCSQPKSTELQLRHPLQPQMKLAVCGGGNREDR